MYNENPEVTSDLVVKVIVPIYNHPALEPLGSLPLA